MSTSNSELVTNPVVTADQQLTQELLELSGSAAKVAELDAQFAEAAAERATRLLLNIGGAQLGSTALLALEMVVLNGPAFDPITLAGAGLASAHIARTIRRENKIRGQREAELTLERLVATDAYYAAALKAMGLDGYEPMPTLDEAARTLTPELVARSELEIRQPFEVAIIQRLRRLAAKHMGRGRHQATLQPYEYDDEYDSEEEGPRSGHDLTDGVRHTPWISPREQEAWRCVSIFSVDHCPKLESMTSERVGELATTLQELIDFSWRIGVDVTAKNGVVLSHISSRTSLPPYDRIEGEKGKLLNFGSDQNEHYTLHYLTHPTDDSDAKIGLWAKHTRTNQQMWIVASLRNGVWHYDGADFQDGLCHDGSGKTYNTTEPTAEDVEVFFSDIEHKLAILQEAKVERESA